MRVANNVLITPMIFIYPEFGQFDYVGESSEDMTIWDIFQEIFVAGLPWDQKKNYTHPRNLKYFVMVSRDPSLISFHRKTEQNHSENSPKNGKREKESSQSSPQTPSSR